MGRLPKSAFRRAQSERRGRTVVHGEPVEPPSQRIPMQRPLEQIVFGFGPYGFWPEVRGTMTASLVAKIQKRMTAEVAEMLSEDGEIAIDNERGGDPR